MSATQNIDVSFPWHLCYKSVLSIHGVKEHSVDDQEMDIAKYVEQTKRRFVAVEFRQNLETFHCSTVPTAAFVDRTLYTDS